MTRRALALLLLREAGPRGVTTAEFLDGGVGSRYGARLLELRREGHEIEAQRLREGSWRYVLENDADVGGGGLEASRTTREPGSYPLATADVGGVPRADGVEGVHSSGGAAQLFPDDDAWEALRAKDAA